jgi:predicted DsbA family dithiol-disulfide isomerase
MIIEMYADVVCPWCYIGIQRLEQALAQRPDLHVERRWRPFQLRPEMPAGGRPWREFANEKFGGMAQAEQIFARVTQIGAQDGLDFRFDRITSAPNTADAHRLILLAQEHGQAWQVARALFTAYFSDGRDLNDQNQLVAIAASNGLPAEQARACLASSAGRSEVEQSQLEATYRGINSVPCYVIDGRYAVLGAQPVETLLGALDQSQAAEVASNEDRC